jgi:adenylosuccinate lyase
MAKHPDLREISCLLHFGCTSEDVNNLAYALMVKEVLAKCVCPSMLALVEDVIAKARGSAASPMLALTHGQPATPTTLGKELANFA